MDNGTIVLCIIAVVVQFIGFAWLTHVVFQRRAYIKKHKERLAAAQEYYEEQLIVHEGRMAEVEAIVRGN